MNFTRAATYHDPTTETLDAARMRADGLAAICIPERMDRDEFFEFLRVFDDEGPFTVSGAAYGEPFAPPTEVAIPELALLRRFELVAHHVLIGSQKGWFMWEPEEGEYHVLFGEPALMSEPIRSILPRVADEWQGYEADPLVKPPWLNAIRGLRNAFTFGF